MCVLVAGCSVVNWVMNALFAKYCSLEDGRSILARRDRLVAAEQQKKQS